MLKRTVLAGVAAAAVLTPCSMLRADGFAVGDKLTVQPAVPLRASPFPLEQVRLLDGPFKEAMLRDKRYLLELEPDRLLHTFRLTAGLPTQARPYGGWEAPASELRGHSAGHYLTALCLMFASTGDEALKSRVDALVSELAKCQAAMPSQGYGAGFLSAYPESFFDRVDGGKPVWAPYYTLHKILAGLLDAYLYCGNKQALEVLENMAAWLKARVDRLGHERQQMALGNEHGGMNEVLANLYAVTGKPEHLALAKAFNHEAIFAPLAKGEDQLNGKHANTQIPKIIGAAREYELTGDLALKDVACSFWKFVALDRSYCIGGHSDGEHFFPIDQFAQHLSPATCETCNTYNMLKLTRHLFAWEPQARLMDFYERALFNQILASQDPLTGMVIYFASLKPGHFKSYSTPDSSFWCCLGTGIENHGKYGDTIYFHGADALYLNLFIASELNWREKGVVVRQETRFPEEDTTRLTLRCEKPVRLALKVRYPAWAADGMTVSVNGNSEAVAGPAGTYVTLDRTWGDKDQVDIRMPMRLRLEALPGASNWVSVLCGPIVLAGELGTEGLENTKPYVKGQLDQQTIPVPNVPVFVCEAKDLLGRIMPVDGKPLTFRTQGVGQPQDVSLSPYYRLHHQRLSVYWRLLTAEDWRKREAEIQAEAARRKALEARITDEVKPGEQQPETDHRLKTEDSRAGDFRDRKWRDAQGWFSYEVKVAPDTPMTLVCTYWGDDGGARLFDILVDGQVVATQKLANSRPGVFFDEQYDLPEALTRGKEKVTVTFRAAPGHTAGGLFGLMLLKQQ